MRLVSPARPEATDREDHQTEHQQTGCTCNTRKCEEMEDSSWRSRTHTKSSAQKSIAIHHDGTTMSYSYPSQCFDTDNCSGRVLCHCSARLQSSLVYDGRPVCGQLIDHYPVVSLRRRILRSVHNRQPAISRCHRHRLAFCFGGWNLRCRRHCHLSISCPCDHVGLLPRLWQALWPW